ncbi:cation transporter [bacterium]|nr:cation transporter [bacterium]
MRRLHHLSGKGSASRALYIAFFINVAFLIVEFIGGLLTNSLALMADAGHMLTDIGGLLIAIIAQKIADRPSSKKRTYGHGRAKVLAAFINGLSLWFIVGVIASEAVIRMFNPPEVESLLMLIIACAGLFANLGSALVLKSHRKEDINIRGAFLHLMADSLGSVAAIIAGLVMLYGGWLLIDPIVSLLISAIILFSSISIVREAAVILLESSPSKIDIEEVRRLLENMPEVSYCHDLHIWSIGADRSILTAHLIVTDDAVRDRLLKQAMTEIQEKFGINHTTIQFESEEFHKDFGCNAKD